MFNVLKPFALALLLIFLLVLEAQAACSRPGLFRGRRAAQAPVQSACASTASATVAAQGRVGLRFFHRCR